MEGELMKSVITLLTITLGIMACSNNHEDAKSTMDDESLRTDLQLLQGRRIYFGHQSVGFDVIAGAKELYASVPNLSLDFVSLEKSTIPSGGFFADSRIGRNNFPNEKCDDFRKNIVKLDPESLDIALMKFCYADIGPEAEVEEIFEHYARTVDTLAQQFPHTIFVHVTVPYTLKTSSWKLFLKKILGREDKSEAANYQRNRFNALLMQRFTGAPVYDLARVESTFPDGQRQSFQYNDTTVYSLIGDYTYDGGHLNETGRKLAARELIRTLANAIKARGK